MNDWLFCVVVVGGLLAAIWLWETLAKHWQWLFVIVPTLLWLLYALNAAQIMWQGLEGDWHRFQKHEQIAAWWAKRTPMEKAIIRDYWTGRPDGEVTQEQLEQGARWDGALKEQPYSSKQR
jgi:hypothetical protein